MDDAFSGCKAPQVDAPSKIEQERDLETCRTNEETEPVGHVEVQQQHVSRSSVLPQEPQEPCVDVPPNTLLETNLVIANGNLTSNSGTHLPSLQPQDHNPVELPPPSPRVASEGHKPSALQECTEISLMPSPGLEASLNDDKGSLSCLKSPKGHQEDPGSELPPCARSAEEEQTPRVDATSCFPSFHSLPCSLSMRLSDGVNPRKRSRSFTLSPKASKVRRTNLWSDPTSQYGGVDVKFVQRQQSHTYDHDITECKPETSEQDPSPQASLTSVADPEDRLGFRNDLHEEPVGEIITNSEARDGSSEFGPPQLYPFFHDDVYQNQPDLDPPELVPSVHFLSTNKTSSASLLSQSFSSICIESALVPDMFFPASSESDWDSGLLSRLAPPVHLQSKEERCGLDLGLLLQSSCSGMQDGSYASRLCSVLQPSVSSACAAFGEPNAIYRTIETMDRRMVQSLGV